MTNTLKTYGKFSPMPGIDTKGLNADKYGISEFLVAPCGLNRDSNDLDKSNWFAQLDALGGESDTVQVHRFDHWACGWFEICLVDPIDLERVDMAEKIQERLENYPILDEDDWFNREFESACGYWAQMSIKERVDHCQRARISVFAARREELPSDDNGLLMELLTRS